MSDFYRVQLDAFEGPMDLLLYLIRKHEVDLHDIPLSLITDQYLGFLEELDSIDIDLAGEFLVTAATLMELKSRMLAAGLNEADAVEDERVKDPESDPRAELVAQLLAYKKYRDAATMLGDRKSQWERRAPVHSAAIDDESVRAAMDDMGELEIEDLDLSDLVNAFRVIVESVDFSRIGEHEVMSDDTPIEVYASDIVDVLNTSLSAHTPTTLRSLITNKPRQEMVGLFLALLVLVRDQRVLIDMEGDEPIININPDYDPSTDPGSPDNADRPIADFV
ncbi:MAG: segregation/condensation protein A [Phycisphaerales bacterium]|nr:segregation/condensation protein A [Phycisphaerales bacterium]